MRDIALGDVIPQVDAVAFEIFWVAERQVHETGECFVGEIEEGVWHEAVVETTSAVELEIAIGERLRTLIGKLGSRIGQIERVLLPSFRQLLALGHFLDVRRQQWC